jgi:hypothetical protein
VVLLFPPVAEKELLARLQIFRGATLARVPGLTLPAEPFGALAAVGQLVVTFLTCGLGWVWGLIDGIGILVNGGYDAQGRKLRDWRT